MTYTPRRYKHIPAGRDFHGFVRFGKCVGYVPMGGVANWLASHAVGDLANVDPELAKGAKTGRLSSTCSTASPNRAT